MRTFVSDTHNWHLLAALIPDVTVTEADLTPEGLVLTAFAPTTSATCPHCGTVSTRVHSYYTRRPRDLPVSGQSVRLVLQLRRFRCLMTECCHCPPYNGSSSLFVIWAENRPGSF